MKRVITMLAGCLLLLTAGACAESTTGTPAGTWPSSTSATSAAPAGTRTFTPSATLQPTQTPTPTITPTPTPPPDLELFNVTIDQDRWTILGEIRNNTNEAMILPPKEPALGIIFDDWQEESGIYLHVVSGPYYLSPFGDDREVNCILYPGETGVLATPMSSFESGDDYKEIKTVLEAPPEFLGFYMREYTSFYKRWKEIADRFPLIHGALDDRYHPATDNLRYEIGKTEIQIGFDIDVVIPFTREVWNVVSWMVLYDREGRIINILYSDFHLVEGYLISNTYHINGVGCDRQYLREEGVGHEWWQPLLKLTEEQLSQVEKIKVLVETESSDICIQGKS